MYFGFIMMGFGVVLGVLNGIGARHDSPQANKKAAGIALTLIVVGALLQWGLFCLSR